jgi:ribosomal protein S12 methylthiotransferase accessory factor
MLPALLDRLERVGIGRVLVVPLSGEDDPVAVAKVLVPQLENPPGERRQRFGRRGLVAMLRSA